MRDHYCTIAGLRLIMVCIAFTLFRKQLHVAINIIALGNFHSETSAAVDTKSLNETSCTNVSHHNKLRLK